MLKFKNIIFLLLFIGVFIGSLSQFLSVVQFGSEKEKTNIRTNQSNESWNVNFDFFGLDMVIDLNNCIYVMAAENYKSGRFSRYYGDLILLKYNSTGDQLWRVDLEGLSLTDSEITVDSKSNLYLASKYDNYSISPNIILLKFNSSGNLLWQQTLESETTIVDISIDTEDNIYIYRTPQFEFSFNIVVEKYNSSGEQLLFHVYENIGDNSQGTDMEIDFNNNVIISGFSYYFENQTSISWIRCYNQSSNLKWEIIDKQGAFFTLAVDSSDNVIVGHSSYIMKYDNLGNLVWQYEHHVKDYWLTIVAVDSFDNVYAATSINIPADHHTNDLYLIKINSSGSFDWYLTWGGPNNEELRGIVIDSFDNIYLLSDHVLIKNPEDNNKSLSNEKLLSSYMVLFGICFFIAGISLYLILRQKPPKTLRNAI